MGPHSALVRFLISKMRVRYIWGVGAIFGDFLKNAKIAKNCRKFIFAQKLPTLKPRQVGVNRTSKNTPGPILSCLDVISHFGQNRFLTDIDEIFPKIASGQEVGMGQHGEGMMGMMI